MFLIWACVSNPILSGSSPSLGSYGMSPSLPLPGQCWHLLGAHSGQTQHWAEEEKGSAW